MGTTFIICCQPVPTLFADAYYWLLNVFDGLGNGKKTEIASHASAVLLERCHEPVVMPQIFFSLLY